ncbi:hypothetical protein EJ04DRAFT_590248 [Polyplosphaeria fusca]|uniref:Uncharacterized protein n=1 Tax=Polyplosphaeria fusca TaxID=682080 RepID=A0A9P4QLV1_9PLEO|nr:hypothetical protein EJ04DRAFT_590248 [Polyplosphaeria fusca]
MVDFRHITDYIFPYHYGPAGGVLNFPDDCLWGTVKCVRINCIGDEQICKRPRFESVGVGLADPIFSENDTSDIADRAGFPIIMRKFSPDPKWLNLGRKDNPSVLYGLQNVNATFLNISCKLSGNIADGVDGFALAPKKYHDYPGSIIVARRDMRPLLPIHAEALCAYCLFEVSPALCSSVENGEKSDRLEIQAALDNICRRTFSSYWRKFVEKKREGDKWLDAPSPFDD